MNGAGNKCSRWEWEALNPEVWPIPVYTQCKNSALPLLYLALQLQTLWLHCGLLQCKVGCGPLPCYLFFLNESLIKRDLQNQENWELLFPKAYKLPGNCTKGRQRLLCLKGSGWERWDQECMRLCWHGLLQMEVSLFCPFSKPDGELLYCKLMLSNETTPLHDQKLLVSTMCLRKQAGGLSIAVKSHSSPSYGPVDLQDEPHWFWPNNITGSYTKRV